MSLGDEFVNIFGLERRKRRQTKVIQDQYIGLDVPPDAFFPGLIRPGGKRPRSSLVVFA